VTPNVTFATFVQEAKAFVPTVVHFGNEISFKTVHPWKALAPAVVTLVSSA
jgi:hypothetical protein